MSKLTDILGLFKYDPETDGANTFNITQALNNNWDKIDQLVMLAVAAAAAYDPEGSYAVGDYCTHGGKLHKCNTAIPDGEAWTAEHWTETSVAAELENKIYQVGDISAELFDDPTHSNGYFASVEDVTDPKPNIPAPGHWRLLYLPYYAASEGWSTQIAVGAVENSGLCWRKASGTKWQPWEFAAIAKPPQVRNLTLQPGFTANSDCTFFVTQESAVFLAGGVSGTLPANQDTQIGTLPADVSPAAQRRRPAVTNAGAAYIDIHTDGTVWAHPFAAALQCWFDTSFVAGGGS